MPVDWYGVQKKKQKYEDFAGDFIAEPGPNAGVVVMTEALDEHFIVPLADPRRFLRPFTPELEEEHKKACKFCDGV